MHVLIMHRPSSIKIPFCHLRWFTIVNLTKSECTLKIFSNVILQIPQNDEQIQRLADIFEAALSNTEIFLVKQVGRLKTKMFYLTVAPQKLDAEMESIMIMNRAGQLGKIL